MKKIVLLLSFFSFQIFYSQKDTLNIGFKKNIISTNLYTAFGRNFSENGAQISYSRRQKIEPKVHFEYFANLCYSPSKNSLNYRKNDSIYHTQTSGISFDFGIRMVKEFRLKNADFEWASSIGFGAIAFDQNDIPKDNYENPNTGNQNTINVDTNLGTLAAVNFGQSLRVFKGNFGLEISANYLPVNWIEKKHLPENLQVFRFGVGSVFRF